VGTIVMLMGIALLFRSGQSLALPPTIGVADIPSGGRWARLGLACLMVGLALKSAIVPLHTWLPDAHGRAPSSISALLSGIVIQSTFYAGLKVSLGLGFPARSLGWVLIWLSMVNMMLGNGMALVQTSAKRLLAYSTVAQMGYVMLSVGIGLRWKSPDAVAVGFMLLLAHAVMKGLAFLCRGACSFYAIGSEAEDESIDGLRGTLARQPLVAVIFALALAGLIGVPPLAGFSAKWFMLLQALRTAAADTPWTPQPTMIYVGIVVFALNNVASLGYFLPMIGAVLNPAPELPGPARRRLRTSLWITVPLVGLGLAVIAIGVYPGPWLEWMGAIADYLM
jgi:formate hydrogenlyase subunit 3/multisubunit Na+/H+ antiporter MnhD subunit